MRSIRIVIQIEAQIVSDEETRARGVSEKGKGSSDVNSRSAFTWVQVT